MTLHPGALRELMHALAMLAADPVTQAEYLRHIRTAPSTDELATTFDDWARLAPQMVELEWLQPEFAASMQALDDELSELDDAAWHVDALPDHPGWARVRAHAKSILFAMGGTWV